MHFCWTDVPSCQISSKSLQWFRRSRVTKLLTDGQFFFNFWTAWVGLRCVCRRRRSAQYRDERGFLVHLAAFIPSPFRLRWKGGQFIWTYKWKLKWEGEGEGWKRVRDRYLVVHTHKTQCTEAATTFIFCTCLVLTDTFGLTGGGALIEPSIYSAIYFPTIISPYFKQSKNNVTLTATTATKQPSTALKWMVQFLKCAGWREIKGARLMLSEALLLRPPVQLWIETELARHTWTWLNINSIADCIVDNQRVETNSASATKRRRSSCWCLIVHSDRCRRIDILTAIILYRVIYSRPWKIKNQINK